MSTPGVPAGAGSPAPSPQVQVVTLPCEPASVSSARRALRSALAGQYEHWLDAAELACSELVTNAVLHAHSVVELTVDVTAERLLVQVRDFSAHLPVPRSYSEQATTGRGMSLVAAITDSHGIDRHEDGKSVWFTLTATGAAAEPSEDELLAAWGSAEWDLDDLLGSDSTRAAAGTTVQLLGLPPLLWLASRQHHDALVRELGLYLAEHDDVDVDLRATDEARATVSAAVVAAVEHAQRTGAARRVLPQGHPSPLPDVPEPLDLELHISDGLGPAFGLMQDTLDVAERLAESGKLLTRPGLPEIIAVRDWACEQITAQLAGVSASRWPGADQERFTGEVHDRDDEPDIDGWDVAVVRDADRGVVASDDSNRILAISRPLADALGWKVDELVGRRVVTLIPPHLREAHVAGFTRALTTGEHHVLDVPLELPVLRRDGTQVQASFLVQQAPTSRGRAMYLAWIEPL